MDDQEPIDLSFRDEEERVLILFNNLVDFRAEQAK